jgi:hypothetical protein
MSEQKENSTHAERHAMRITEVAPKSWTPQKPSLKNEFEKIELPNMPLHKNVKVTFKKPNKKRFAMNRNDVIKAIVRFVFIVLGVFGKNFAPGFETLVVEILIAVYGAFELIFAWVRRKKEEGTPLTP